MADGYPAGPDHTHSAALCQAAGAETAGRGRGRRVPVALPVPTVFHEPWWLKAASKGKYEEVTVSSGGLIVGRLPFVRRKVAGQTVLTMPSMTHVLGPALATDITEAKVPRLLREVSVTAGLIEQLPKASHIWFRLHGGLRNTLAFDAAGYMNAANFTVEIPPAPAETLWLQMRDKTRNVIRRAQERLNVITWSEAKPFLDFYDANLRERSSRNQYERATCDAVVTECLRRDAGRIIVAVNSAGSPEAAIFTVWDSRSEFYFMSTRTAHAINGASSLLIWTAMQRAAAAGRMFDMDIVHVVGRTLPNLTLLTGFGGVLRPRFHVKRTSALLLTAQHCKQLVQRMWHDSAGG